MSISPQSAQATCPECRTPFQITIHQLIDAEKQPELKHQLLAGQINIATCSSCQARMAIAAPLTYHDASKQICFLFLPQEIKLTTEEEQKYVGEVTNALLADLPAGVSRGYLLTPRRFLSLLSLVDAVLEADGIPREVIEKQRTFVELISQLAEAIEDEEQFNRLVAQNKASMDYEFFVILSSFIDASIQEKQEASAQLLTRLRDKLMKATGFSGEEGEDEEVNLDEVFQRLETASEEELQEAIADVRYLIDDSFYQTWKTRIETIGQGGEKERAQALLGRLSLVIRMVEQMDKEARALVDESTKILHEALEAPDPEPVLQKYGDQINEAFLMILAASMEATEKTGQQELMARMKAVQQAAVGIIQSKLTPEERLINELMLAESSQERRGVLQQHMSLVTADFVRKLNEIADEREKYHDPALVAHLRQIAREAGAMLF